MLKRLSYAFAGASAITVVLIFGMSQIAEFLERPDSQIYMRVMDFIPGSGARRLPDKRMPEAQPERARVDTGEIATDALPGLDAGASFQQETQEIEVSVDLVQPSDTRP